MKNSKKTIIKYAHNILGTEKYLRMRERILQLQSREQLLRKSLLQYGSNFSQSTRQRDGKDTKFQENLVWIEDRLTAANTVLSKNTEIAMEILNDAGVSYWLVHAEPGQRRRLAVDVVERDLVLDALRNSTDLNDYPIYVMDPTGKNPQYSLQVAGAQNGIREASILRICCPTISREDKRRYGFAYGADIEFWSFYETYVEAPRENKASKILSYKDFDLRESSLDGREIKIPNVFTKRMLDDVTFDVDVVYTWVDGSDENWRNKRDIYKESCTEDSNETQFHAEATSESRFTSRDELKYSLRSLDLYAPWVRKIYIVTDNQIPHWLKIDHPKINIVDHGEIIDAKFLPTFNSNVIISNIHKIKGLSEHFLFFNDDVLLGANVTKSHFFSPAGIAYVSPSNNRRPFGDPTVISEPHFNITRNIRRALEERFGVTISRAIKHTPHPMIKSVMEEMHKVFHEEFTETYKSRFRHHSDIVGDQLYHYYSQIIGRAVPGRLSYNYINIMNDAYLNTLHQTLIKRNRHAICLNDAPVDGAIPIPDYEINKFLEQYYPAKSEYEN